MLQEDRNILWAECGPKKIDPESVRLCRVCGCHLLLLRLHLKQKGNPGLINNTFLVYEMLFLSF